MTVKLQLNHVGLSKRLHDVCIDVTAGDFIQVMGANGSGKSTLLSLVAGLISADRGTLSINGKSINAYSTQELGLFRTFLEQSQNTSFSLSVKESLSFYSCAELPVILDAALEVNEFMEKPLNLLSGGEQQRVHLARVLMQIWPALENGEGLVLLDEPFQGLDFRHQLLLCELLKQLSKMGNLIIISQHDLNLCERYADQVWLMQYGKLAGAGKPSEALTVDRLEKVFECRVEVVIGQNNQRLFSNFIG